MTEPTVTTRIVSDGQYTTASYISFGSVPPQSVSPVIVIDAKFDGFQSVGEPGIGVASSNLQDGLSDVLFFEVIDSPDYLGEPTRTFSGVAGDSGSNYVETVGLRSASESKYVALMVKAKDTPIDCACVVMKWFFGYYRKF